MSEYALFQSSLPASHHERTLDILRYYRLGDDTPHARVPVAILNDPAVREAVAVILGPNAQPDVCRHVHVNNCPEDGPWHRDNYDEGPWPEGDFAVLFYFPQDTPLEMGGTAIRVDGQEIIAAGPAGMCLVAPGDVDHRARANTTGRQRFMVKYLFRRILR